MTIDHAACAEELRATERSATPVPLLTERYPGLTWDDARTIARARDALRLADGDRLIGYKLGWTSAAMREALGIERPNWGTLWASQVVDDRIELAELIHPKAEPELVFEVPSPGEEGRWALGLEVVDPRWPSFRFDWLDNTADNSSGARIAIGEFALLAGDVAAVGVDVTDGGDVRSGVGANAMDSPALAVDWLAESLAVEDTRLEPGQIVFTGGLTAPYDLTPATTYSLRSDTLPPVTVTTSAFA